MLTNSSLVWSKETYIPIKGSSPDEVDLFQFT
jgi:hypothetical protein